MQRGYLRQVKEESQGERDSDVVEPGPAAEPVQPPHRVGKHCQGYDAGEQNDLASSAAGNDVVAPSEAAFP